MNPHKPEEMRVAGIFIYPVKSCRAIALPSSRVTESGLHNDRSWMIVDAAGVFISQRTHPRLALIGVDIGPEALTLSALGMPTLKIPPLVDEGVMAVSVWRDRCNAISAGAEAAQWLSDFMHEPLRLVRWDATSSRRVTPKFLAGTAASIAFADAYPILVISEASLADLNRRLTEPVPMDRFRPNLVIAGGTPYCEDDLNDFVIGDTGFRTVKPCTRCRTTATDQATGITHPLAEPLRTLARYRYDRQLSGVTFGNNTIVTRAGETPISVGETIRR